MIDSNKVEDDTRALSLPNRGQISIWCDVHTARLGVARERAEKRKLGTDGLATAGGRANKHVLISCVQRVEHLCLNRVEVLEARRVETLEFRIAQCRHRQGLQSRGKAV